MRPRVVVALLTPFDEDGDVDDGALAAHVDFLVEAGVDALMPCGTTGEGPLLDAAEVAEVVADTVAAARGRVPVLAHVGRPDTDTTVWLAAQALDTGAAGVSAVVPYYYALSEEQVVRHYGALLEAVPGADVYAYTIPERTGNELSPAAVRALAAEGLRGVKDSTKSLERHLEYLACGVECLIGTDALVLPAFRAGASGCVSALANVRPDLLAALRDGGGEEAQAEVSRLRDELRQGPPLVALKRAVAERIPGYPASLRAPLG